MPAHTSFPRPLCPELPQPPPALRARGSLEGPWAGLLPAAAVKPLTPRPHPGCLPPCTVWVTALPAFQVLFGKYAGRTFPENVLRMFGIVQLPGTEAFSPSLCVQSVGVGQVLLWSSDQGV